VVQNKPDLQTLVKTTDKIQAGSNVVFRWKDVHCANLNKFAERSSLCQCGCQVWYRLPATRLLKGGRHFSQSIVVSVAISSLEKRYLFSLELKSTILNEDLLPDIGKLSGSNLIF